MKISKIYLIYFVLFVCLFFPIKYFDFYHIIMIGCSVFLVKSYGFSSQNKILIEFYSLFLFFIVISIFIGMLLYKSDPVRNFTEIVRFLPSFILIFSLRNAPIYLVIQAIKNVFFIYSFLCLSVSLLQVNSAESISIITDLYSADVHIKKSLDIASRALGFSLGPGQNGVMMALIFSFSLAQITIENRKIKSLLTMIFSFSVVILSQSQTALIVSLGIFSYYILFSLFVLKGQYRAQAMRYFLFLLPVAFFSVLYFKDNLKYLFTLFDDGFDRSSYRIRVNRTDYLFDIITDNPLTLLFGHGKDFFGRLSGAMDNEYIFHLGVYGLFSTVMILCVYLYFIFLPYLKGSKFILNNKFYLHLHFITIVGVIMAWPSAFITDPRILFIVSLLYVIYNRSLHSFLKSKPDLPIKSF